MTGYKEKEEVGDYSKLEKLLEDAVVQDVSHVSTDMANIIYFHNGNTQEYVDVYIDFVEFWKGKKTFVRNVTTTVEFDKLYEITPPNTFIEERENFSPEMLKKQLDAIAEKKDTIQIFTNIQEYKFTNRSIKCLIKE